VLSIVVVQESARVPVAVMSLEGELDAASYLDALASAREAIEGGANCVLLDLEKLTYMGSSGIFVIQSVAMLLRGQQPPSPEDGWGAIHQAGQDSSDAPSNLKLLAPQPQVDRVLERSGMKRFFETYTDRSEALESF
jgi:anti-anti-sigma regulatory factor